MENLLITIKAGLGKYTPLDKAYKALVNSIIDNDSEHLMRWVTYEDIIQNLLSLGKDNYFEEIKYRITDGEDPNLVMLDIIHRDEDTINNLSHIKRRLKQFIDDDLLNRFIQ